MGLSTDLFYRQTIQQHLKPSKQHKVYPKKLDTVGVIWKTLQDTKKEA